MTETHTPEPVRPLGWTGPTGVKIVAHMHYLAATDNRLGARQTLVQGTAEVYDWTGHPKYREDGFTGTEISLPLGLDLFQQVPGRQFLLINQETSESLPYYVASYHPEKRNIGLKRETPSPIFDSRTYAPVVYYSLYITGTDRLKG